MTSLPQLNLVLNLIERIERNEARYLPLPPSVRIMWFVKEALRFTVIHGPMTLLFDKNGMIEGHMDGNKIISENTYLPTMMPRHHMVLYRVLKRVIGEMNGIHARYSSQSLSKLRRTRLERMIKHRSIGVPNEKTLLPVHKIQWPLFHLLGMVKEDYERGRPLPPFLTSSCSDEGDYLYFRLAHLEVSYAKPYPRVPIYPFRVRLCGEVVLTEKGWMSGVPVACKRYVSMQLSSSLPAFHEGFRANQRARREKVVRYRRLFTFRKKMKEVNEKYAK